MFVRADEKPDGQDMNLPPGWNRLLLKDLIRSLDAGVSVNAEDRPARGGEYGVLKTSSVTFGIFKPEENKAILASEVLKAVISPRRDRIILSRMNTPGLVGASAWVPSDYPNLFLPDRLWQLEPVNSKVSMRWLSYLLASPKYRNKLGEIATGTSNSMKNISKTDVLSFEIPVPPIKQQVEIAQILSTWDTAIEKTERLLALRKQQKKWLIDRIAGQPAPAFRLGDFLNRTVKTVPKPSQPYRALGIRSHGKGTFQRIVENPATVDMDELFAVKRNDLIVNITFAWEGAIAIVKPEDEGCLVSHRFPTYEFDRSIAIPEFVKFLINRKPFFSQLALISPGGAGRNRVLNKKDFLKLTLNLPDIPQQRRFAEILGTMNRLIEIETELLLKLKEQKRGLLQKLLTGQWRIKVADTEAA